MELLKDTEKKLANKFLFITTVGAIITFIISIIVFYFLFSNQSFENMLLDLLNFAKNNPFIASIMVSLFLLFASIIIIIMTYILIGREIIEPLDKVIFHIEEISKGNLENEIKVNRKDELGVLQDSIERLRISLTILMKKLEEKE
ncbi:MAG: hypothetical protein DSY47_01735 [Hydrogenothermus sp.]|nr:MAG: hypothetical protein DSY47_01735 [Hydrogenothermus sp.]